MFWVRLHSWRCCFLGQRTHWKCWVHSTEVAFVFLSSYLFTETVQVKFAREKLLPQGDDSCTPSSITNWSCRGWGGDIAMKFLDDYVASSHCSLIFLQLFAPFRIQTWASDCRQCWKTARTEWSLCFQFCFESWVLLMDSSLLYILLQDTPANAESEVAESPQAFYVHSPGLDSSPVATSPADEDSGWQESSPEFIVSSPEWTGFQIWARGQCGKNSPKTESA